MKKNNKSNSAKSDATPSVEGKSSQTNALTWPVLILIIGIAIYVWQTKSSLAVQNLSNADIDTLKSHMFGEKPYLFYCDRGKSAKKPEVMPKTFTELQSLYKSQIGFATVNCSQVLPSGVSLWEKFKLKREWRPAVFATAPWMRLKQIPVNVVENRKALQRFVDVDMRAQATSTTTDTDFAKYCGFGKDGDSTTCLVIVKGTKYGESQQDIEEKLVKKHAKIKFAKFSGGVSSFNFEHVNTGANDKLGLAKGNKYNVPVASEYAMRMYAIRDGTMYLPMTYSPTLTYMDTFVSHALNAPDADFTSYGDASKSNVTIHLFKKKTEFKQRASAAGSANSNTLSDEEQENAKRIDEMRKRREQRKVESLERERKRAEEVENEMQQNTLFEDADAATVLKEEELLDAADALEDANAADSENEETEQDEVEDMIEL